LKLYILLFLLLAAFLHSTWHAMIKVSSNRLISLAGMNIVSVFFSLVLLPVVGNPFHDSIIWFVFFLSVTLHNIYKIGVSKIYNLGDLSKSYPITRGFSPLFSTLISILILRELPSFTEWIGIIIVSIGLILMSMEKVNSSFKYYFFAALTGLMVASYSVVDAYGSRISENWFAFTVWLMLFDGLSFIVIVHLISGRLMWKTIGQNWRYTLISGGLGICTFLIFIWALSHESVGVVSTLRETSILFTSLIGYFVLKEKWNFRRRLASIAIMLGITVFLIKV
jgi:drug/metabolite transporter (DMT)-like permease